MKIQYRMICAVVLACFLGAMKVVADGKITSISIQDMLAGTSSVTTNQKVAASSTTEPTESVVLKVETKSGNKYQIQGVGKLGQDIWTSLGDAFSGDSTIQTIALYRNDAFHFFRVVILKKNETLREPKAPAATPPSIPAAPPTF